MKELSIEEKAKAYDKAIKKAKKLYEQGTITESLSYVFPELKESEDERIRKEMIFYFQEEIPQCSIQEHSDKMREFISWLKRQEIECIKLELKAGNSYFCYKSRWERADNETFKKGLIYKCNKDGVLDNFVIKNPEQHFIEIKDERIAWLEKQDEQKPAHIDYVSEIREELLSIEDNAKNINGLTESQWVAIRAAHRLLGEYITKEQKPTVWSEDDEIEIQYLLDTLRYVKDNRNGIIRAHYNDEILDRCTNWLKSFKDKVQPKQEWGEEDEMITLSIEQVMNCASLLNIVPDKIDKIRTWLKSLKERYSWKPSDEQIEILDMVLTNESMDDNIARILRELREQLKKLKE